MFNEFAVKLSFCSFSKCFSGADFELKKNLHVFVVNNKRFMQEYAYAQTFLNLILQVIILQITKYGFCRLP